MSLFNFFVVLCFNIYWLYVDGSLKNMYNERFKFGDKLPKYLTAAFWLYNVWGISNLVYWLYHVI